MRTGCPVLHQMHLTLVIIFAVSCAEVLWARTDKNIYRQGYSKLGQAGEKTPGCMGALSLPFPPSTKDPEVFPASPLFFPSFYLSLFILLPLSLNT